jgi:Protein of unknown function (DUF1302)
VVMILKIFKQGEQQSGIGRVLFVLFFVLGLSQFQLSYAKSKWDTSGFIENQSRERFHGRGLSKSRTTAQFEASRNFGKVGIFKNFSFNGTFRGSYDAAYELNDGEFGDNAGGPITMTSSAAGGLATPWGQSLVSTATPGLGFGFDTTANPNDGLILLGSNLHSGNQSGAVQMGVPVRPCDEDSRGCIDGYLDFDKHELASPEFNDRADFIREAYISGTIPLSNGAQLDLSLGRKQEIWGRTDLFRVLDVVNPVDFSRNNIYDELEDIRIPMGMFTAEYRAGATNTFDDLNFQLLWKWEQFRPNNLGQGGSPNAILDAGSFFRAMNNCWENGCTVGNFAGLGASTDFPKHTIGIRQANLPGWEVEETDIGGRIEGVYKGIGFSLNTLYYRSQLPVLTAGDIPANNPFTPGEDLANRDYLIAFDIDFPRIFMLGGSTDFYVDSIKTAFRTEFAYTVGEEFANTLRRELHSDSDVIRWVIGADRPTFIPFLNKNRAFLISGQLFAQHILNHELEDGPLGKRGVPDWKDNFIGTLLVKGWYKNDRVSPQMITAYDVRAQAGVIEPSVDWLISNNWRLMIGANLKFGTAARPFDDNRSANAFPPFTGAGATAASIGAGGYEPLGRFRSGPIGSAQNEDEVFITLRYRF